MCGARAVRLRAAHCVSGGQGQGQRRSGNPDLELIETVSTSMVLFDILMLMRAWVCSRAPDARTVNRGTESHSLPFQVYIKDFRVFQGSSLDTRKMKQVVRVSRN